MWTGVWRLAAPRDARLDAPDRCLADAVLRPRGLEFPRATVEVKAAETVLHLRRASRRLRNMVPRHIWNRVSP